MDQVLILDVNVESVAQLLETENIRQHVDLHIHPSERVYIIYYTYTIIFYVMQQHPLKGGSYITVYIYVN